MSKHVKEQHIHYNKFNTEKFIKKSIQIWGNKYDYSKTEYIDSKTKVTIICNEHKEFEQLPSNHYNYGCGSCGHSKNVRNVELKEKCKNNFEMKLHNLKFIFVKQLKQLHHDQKQIYLNTKLSSFC